MSVGALTTTVAALGLAQPGPAADYGLSPEPWNGLGYLITTAEEAKVVLEVVPSVDLSALSPDETLFLVYPTAPLAIDDLVAYVDAGGSLVVADDFGTSAPLLARVGIQRSARGPTEHHNFFSEQSHLPMLTPAGEHFLFFNVEHIVANHPATLSVAPGAAGPSSGVRPILSFDGGREHLIVESPHGSGAVLAIADASLFLNEMQRRFYGNKQLAANVLRFYCQREPCRVRLLMPGGGFSGRFDPAKHRLGTLPRDLEEAIAGLDEALAELEQLLATPPWAWAVLALTGALTLALALGALARFRRPITMPIAADLAPRGLPPSLDEAAGLVQQRLEADFAGMSQTLADQGLELIRVYDLEAVARSDTTPSARERQQLADAVLRVRAEAVSLQARQPPVVSADRFLRLHSDVELLTRWARGRRRVRGAQPPGATPPGERPPTSPP
ncbi:MAG: hypothetical protein IT385_04380 [Deltaproteobacteria bacterium]|nr:hypothetical protein [Deltaproteobacteria bacterium]